MRVDAVTTPSMTHVYVDLGFDVPKRRAMDEYSIRVDKEGIGFTLNDHHGNKAVGTFENGAKAAEVALMLLNAAASHNNLMKGDPYYVEQNFATSLAQIYTLADDALEDEEQGYDIMVDALLDIREAAEWLAKTCGVSISVYEDIEDAVVE